MKKLTYLALLLVVPFIFLFSACGEQSSYGTQSSSNNVEVEVYIDGQKVDTVYTKANKDYKIEIPKKPEDITTNPNLERYFYGWFLDVGFNIPLTIDTKFTQDSKIYGKWIDAYSNDFNYKVSEGVATITAFDNIYDATVLVIPHYINSFPVEAIASSAFAGQTKLRHVFVCDGIQTIGTSAFSGCSSLQSIVLPQTLKIIETSLFSNCKLLAGIDLPEAIEEIKSNAFNDCTSLTSVRIPKGMTSLSVVNAFKGCDLENITIDNDNPVYDSRQNCNAIIETATNTLVRGYSKSTIPTTVTSIGDSAFYECKNLTSIVIPSNVISIGDEAFNGCISLVNITLYNGLTSIGNYAFLNCINLTNVKLPSSLTSIGEYAFESCTQLSTIIIPRSVVIVGNFAFYNCGSLIIYCESSIKPSNYSNNWARSRINGGDHTIYWYSDIQPIRRTDCWHYVDGVVTTWPYKFQ